MPFFFKGRYAHGSRRALLALLLFAFMVAPFALQAQDDIRLELSGNAASLTRIAVAGFKNGTADGQNDALRQRALESGFANALLYPCGVAFDPADDNLMLIDWLPLAQSWRDAAPALEAMLNQRDALQAALGGATSVRLANSSRSRDAARFMARLRP